MSIEATHYDTATLGAVMREMEGPSNYWLGFYGSEIQFTDEYIDFSQITDNRKMAPLVVPTAQGKPIWSAAEKVQRVKPAYVKAKDPVSATRVIKRVAGFGELAPNATAMSPQARYNAIITDILNQHKMAVERRWEWLAAEATIYGKVTLESDDYPKTLVDFERDAGHDIVLTGTARWGQSGVSILSTIEGWKKTVRDAKFGGATNRLTVGTDAWEVMRQDTEIRELLKLDFRNSNNGLEMNLGVMEGLEIERVGKINGTTEIVVYSDYYQDPDGTTVPFMASTDVVLTGPSVRGVRCFGAIQDKRAGWAATPIFSKMWDSEDPSATNVMTQSAPLMVPVGTNNTLRATVV
jgi:hypothetical protein